MLEIVCGWESRWCPGARKVRNRPRSRFEQSIDSSTPVESSMALFQLLRFAWIKTGCPGRSSRIGWGSLGFMPSQRCT